MRNPGRNRRPYFNVVLIICAVLVLFIGRQTDTRSIETRTACVVVWIAFCLLYAALAWRTRAWSREWRTQDILTVVVLAAVALYEAHWPYTNLWITPDNCASIWGASSLGSYFGTMLRKGDPGREAGGGTADGG